MTAKFKTDERCVGCNVPPPNALHHLISRGAGGPDHPSNLIPLCVVCHDFVHRSGLTKLAHKGTVKAWIEAKGWRYDTNYRKWRAPMEMLRFIGETTKSHE